MISSHPTIDLKVKNVQLARSLREALTSVPEFAVITEPVQRTDYDAMFLSLPMAERWGSKPAGENLQVLPTAPDDRDIGFPSWVITGFVPSEPAQPDAVVQSWAKLLAAALRQHPWIRRVLVDTDLTNILDLEHSSPDFVGKNLVAGWRSGNQQTLSG
jgi:hypothetical protein